MRLHSESHHNVAARMARCNNFVGCARPVCPRPRAGRCTDVRVPIAGDALVMGAVRQVETIDEKAIADVELIERQRQGIRSREVASARHGKW